MKKIIVAGLMMDTNLGEEIYPQCFCYLLQRWNEQELDFKFLDLYGRAIRCEDNTTEKSTDCLIYSKDCNIIERMLIKYCSVVGIKIGLPEISKHLVWYFNPNNKKRIEKYYREKMKGSSLLIFAGGGIIECSTNHDYYHHIELITKIADEMKIPVCFNAVGKVVDPRHMFGWSIMKKSLNRKCVKSITCRDGYEWINENCFNKRKIATIGPCCAICTDEAYGIKKNEASNLVGIGVIRGNIFASYGIDFGENKLIKLYADMIRLLCKKGYKCCLFTNGYSGDIEFAKKLYQYIDVTDVLVYKRPECAEELINQIAGFKGMITARLHSCIVAYSLQIPTVAISWTKKVSDFMHLIGNSDCAISLSNLNADYIVSQFEKVLEHGYDIKLYSNLKDQVTGEINRIYSYIE